MMRYMGSVLKVHFHPDRLAIEEADIPKLMINDPERPQQRNHPKQLETYNVPTYDVEITNGID